MQDYKPRVVFEDDVVKITQVHGGQKRAYGDSYYEYDVTGDELTENKVYELCQQHARKCGLPASQWRQESKEGGMSAHFRESWSIKTMPFGGFRYTVVWPWTG